MQFQPGDQVTITNPHAENAAYKGKTGTIWQLDNNGLFILKGVDRPIREKLLGYVACSPNELTKA